MMVLKRIATLSGVLAGLFIAASGALAQSDVPSVSAPLGDMFKVPNLLVKDQSRVVFYRDGGDASKLPPAQAVSVFIDGAYHASVQKGAYTDVCLPPGKVEVAARTIDNQSAPKDAFDVINSLNLKGGEEVFVKVIQEANNRAVMMVTQPERALRELIHTRQQRHTVTRVPAALTCEDRHKTQLPKVVVTSAPLRKATLSADALFEFGKSSIDAIPPKGRRLLDHMVDRIKSEFGSGKDVQIRIIGHADRFGSEAGNLRISKERAASIKTYFVQSGLLDSSITTDGKGDKEPVVTTCGVAYTKANVACNKPNRRVDLEVRKDKGA